MIADFAPHEIGGEFHLQDFPLEALDRWPAKRSFFATGRAALIALWTGWIEMHPQARLFMPEYFCSEVINSLQSRNIPITFYADDPERSGPDLHRLPAAPWDMVLAVNYFGVRSGDSWNAWRAAHPSNALVEDHTHDPQSAWARSSEADFAFASLRKTIPVPDGAIAWSPRGCPMPAAARGSSPLGSSLKLAAMLYKRQYLESGEASLGLKRTFLELQKRGEQLLPQLRNEAISAWSLERIQDGTPTCWRRKREYNVRLLLTLAPGVDGGKPLFSCWPTGCCPFNAVYLFDDERTRDLFRARLISALVYTPVHWSLHHGGKAFKELSKRILTIPLDFRYGDREIARIAQLLTTPALPKATNPHAK